MQINFVFNHLSLPVQDKNLGHKALLDTVKGMLASLQFGDTPVIYGDGVNRFRDFEIAAGYRCEDFINELAQVDSDLQLTLIEIDDKMPMLDFMSDEQIESISNHAFYFPDEGYKTTIDILGVAWELDAILLSLNTGSRWENDEVCFAKYSTGPMLGYSYLTNISQEKHGLHIYEQKEKLEEKSLSESFPSCNFSPEFLEWVAGLAKNLQTKVKGKISLASSKEFCGGGPLFDSLEDADGMREVRFSNTEGGAVRIIFKDLPNKKHAILVGFIKKSNNEGYDQAIASARGILKRMAS